jgi:hypothetical protein
MATLRDLGAQPFEVVPADGLPVTAPADRWAVLVGTAGPVSALAPGTSLAGDGRPPGILVAVADLELAEAFASDAFQQLTEVSALVLIEPATGEAGEPGIAGVVSGQALTYAILRGTVRGFTSPVLPGAPTVPLISRSCGYLEGRVTCTTPMSFRRRPPAMPPCPNEHGLTAHPFGW